MVSIELKIAEAVARDNLPERQCRVCGEMKGPGEFPRDAGKRDGLSTRCKVCNAAQCARYYAANTDKERERQARWAAENADKVREHQARWRAANADKVRERKARYYAENPDKLRAAKRRRRARKRANGVIPYQEADVWGAYDHACIACGSPGEHVDHFTAIANGGPDAITNVVILCEACNLSKGARDPLEFLASRGIRFDRVVYVDE